MATIKKKTLLTPTKRQKVLTSFQHPVDIEQPPPPEKEPVNHPQPFPQGGNTLNSAILETRVYKLEQAVSELSRLINIIEPQQQSKRNDLFDIATKLTALY